MNKLYLGIVLLYALLMASCGHSSLTAIENIHHRQQLDSLIATLSKSQVQVDSVPVRVLVMHLKGDFTYYGQPVKELQVELKEEAIARISFQTEKGALEVLNGLESAFGTGFKESSGPDLTWKTVEKNIIFTVTDYKGNLLTLGNKEKSYITLYFNQPANNKVTNAYITVPATGASDNYRLEVDNSECGYRVYVNGFLALTHLRANTLGVTADINSYLQKGSKQTLMVELLPGVDFDGYPRSRLHQESVVTVAVHKWSDQSCFSPVILQFKTPNADTMIQLEPHYYKAIRASRFSGQLSATINQTFETTIQPFDLPAYATATDIRKVPDAKDRVVAHYRKLQAAYQSKDTQQLANLLFPLEQNKAMAWHLYKPTDGQAQWKSIIDLAHITDTVTLAENTSLYVTPDGRFAKLIIDGKDDPACYIEDANKVYPLDYYVSIDKNNEPHFVIE
ncbi:hypothetical protein HGH93_13075 [Chitinophaga polysaccharea]|uniref:hypothetical protein n=1 Tax=Chitinophaga polysaccharea TaxID=1293035 RepID=UPI0014554C4D|nr:hypothetical protein [Chitinophaga polysaccharea]NLR59040.1 hypothetical protein [Chitinophaga polysaccharea]